ncbi:MAG: valine--tRNA ligase [Candidatus Dasytiphilus stammeri]
MHKKYNPKYIEQQIYEQWEKIGCFQPHGDLSKESFCIMIPPPNITGTLHIGHAFQYTIIDTLIRYYRMQGKNTLWQVGTDHAGIATQIIVERQLALEKNINLNDIGREAFIKHVFLWKKESCKIIKKQMKRLGCSADWSRERFTMDEGFSKAVIEVFVQLYKEGLIYRGKKLVNWDSVLCSAVSDLEVDHRKHNGFMWFIRYLLTNNIKTNRGKNYLVVATTRPETLLGDSGIAVNPYDHRYKDLVGKFVHVPFVERCIPIIADKQIDMNQGTGCMKITPAHDFKDYEIGQRHKLPLINIFNVNGTIRTSTEILNFEGQPTNIYSTKIPTQFHNLKISVARRKIISQLETLNMLEAIKPYTIVIPYCNRSGVIIEPMITNQWYMRTQLLADQALTAVKTGQIKFLHKDYENMYLSWMNHIEDWCISRQLWWGHRIPAWYDNETNIYVGRNEKEIRINNNLDGKVVLHQDNDVLDTWFSSSLWTFASLGWPDKNKDLHIFHPTKVIVSGFDIIFFWIARMIMLTMHFIKDEKNNGQIPFQNIYLTGLIRDEEGHKMSKSKGNIIDPIDIIDGISLEDLLKKRTEDNLIHSKNNYIYNITKKKFPNGIIPYGADALRLTLTSLASNNRNIHLNMKKIEHSRNFCNKLWNACRFVLLNVEKEDQGYDSTTNNIELSIADKWIKAMFNNLVKDYHKALKKYRLDIAYNVIYEFTWHHFCDWYLEICKIIINTTGFSGALIRGVRNTMIDVFESLLRLAHPIIPFITENLWQRLILLKFPNNMQTKTIMLQSTPKYDFLLENNQVIKDMNWIKEFVTAIRNIRAKMNIIHKPLKLWLLLIDNKNNNKIMLIINNHKTLLKSLVQLESITFISSKNLFHKNEKLATQLITGAEIIISLKGMINKEMEQYRLNKEITKLSIKIEKLEKKLSEKSFFYKAPKSVIIQYKERLTLYLQQKKILINLIRNINS